MVSLNRPDSSVFDGIQPLDLSWFQVEPGKRSYACAGVYALDRAATNVTPLADFCEIHAYLDTPDQVLKYTGTPLLEAQLGKGVLLASEMMVDAGVTDPIAQRLYSNLIAHLAK
jgi:hypothetical protein